MSTPTVQAEQQPVLQTPLQPLMAAAPAPAGVAAAQSTLEAHEQEAPEREPASSETSCCCGLGDLITRLFAAIGDSFRAFLNWLCCREEEEVQQAEDPLVAQDPNGGDYAERQG